MQEECQLQVRKDQLLQRDKEQPEAQRELVPHKSQPMAVLQEPLEI